MSKKKENKADEIIKRVFNLIGESYFNDHKMVSFYVNPPSFRDRSLGDDIGDWMQAYYPEIYHKKRKGNEN
jgi:hypothetical protein